MTKDPWALLADRGEWRGADEIAAKAISDLERGPRSPGPVGAPHRRQRVPGAVIAGIAFIVVLIAVGLPVLLSGRGAEPVSSTLPVACPVTVPGDNAFTPASETPEAPPSVYDVVWYGTPDLWTLLDREGQLWTELPIESDGSLTNKTFWWSEEYSPGDTAEIRVTAEPVDGSAPTVETSVTMGVGYNPFMTQPSHESVTVVGVDLPERGCWKITGHYKDVTLSFTVSVP